MSVQSTILMIREVYDKGFSDITSEEVLVILEDIEAAYRGEKR